ncbi:MAG: hypothetical protein mread185_000362 [Mycoplasmataceae bacterium]|nr:MAG: hypothetical protein mread185_000362 [Mycoplasmataceae bacterium]
MTAFSTFRNVFGGFLLASALVAGSSSTVTEVGGRTVQYTSLVAKKVFTATEFMGEKIADGSGWVKNKSWIAKDYALDLLDSRRNEYRDLNIDYQWRGKLIENNWTEVNTFNKK